MKPIGTTWNHKAMENSVKKDVELNAINISFVGVAKFTGFSSDKKDFALRAKHAHAEIDESFEDSKEIFKPK